MIFHHILASCACPEEQTNLESFKLGALGSSLGPHIASQRGNSSGAVPTPGRWVEPMFFAIQVDPGSSCAENEIISFFQLIQLRIRVEYPYLTRLSRRPAATRMTPLRRWYDVRYCYRYRYCYCIQHLLYSVPAPERSVSTKYPTIKVLGIQQSTTGTMASRALNFLHSPPRTKAENACAFLESKNIK
ncbi:hypothetical protein BDV37DRAFT_183658 [Aspergillus pseudonomiae]|uniref:Uncharacterized protein n=1 Tax=Aspergillus pseudonomiae TaxID=1506151 RepID=A0A5N7D4X9_9EURO|nr:uncharacterized protein BDV37DRAFT_183658 [Aspergillus pseudonomiae]KAE8401349.1 hypothetical protein BDV37DRAFT_183658 [Aspergillus pseudonomiae]